MKKTIAYIILQLLCAFSSFELSAQFEVDSKIILDSSGTGRITNVGESIHKNDGVSAFRIQSGMLVSGFAIQDTIIKISTFFPTDTLEDGMLLRVLLQSNISGENAKINSAGPFTIRKNDSSLIQQKDFYTGKIIWIMYYDSSLYVQTDNGISGCPPGFAKVNDEYCIKISELPPNTYWFGQQYCESLGARLCNWGEWYYACQSLSVGMLNKTNNWEWIDGAQNHTNAGSQLGNAACTANRSINVFGGTVAGIRCCYTR